MKRKSSAFLLCCSLATGPAFAGGSQLDFTVPTVNPFQQSLDYSDASQWQAANTMEASSTAAPTLAFTKDNEQYEESWLTGSKAHQYMGIGALALVALAAISPKEENSAHEYFATGAALLGAGAATTGFIYHWEDFHFRDGFTDPDNMHMMLGFLGSLAMVAAVSKAPEGGHAGLGIVGGVAMGTAIKITW